MTSTLPTSADRFRQPHADPTSPAHGAIAAEVAIAGSVAAPPARIWPSGWEDRGERDLRWAATALAALICFCIAIQMAWPLAALGRHISLNNNEGWNAYWSARALAGQPLYTGEASSITNNYPPLSFYIVGWPGYVIGDLVLAGRLISLIALGGCTILVGAIAARFAPGSKWPWAAAAAFLMFAVSMARRYVASDDPQWLAEAVQLLGLWVLVSQAQRRATAPRIIVACLTILFAGLIKHNQVALPLAITIAFAIHDRRALAIWLATASVAVAAALLVLHHIYGPAFLDQVLFHQREMKASYLLSALTSLAFLLPAGLILFAYVPRLGGWGNDMWLTLLALFAPLAILLGLFERAGAGVSQNAHFDALLSIMILLGIILAGGLRQRLSVATKLALLTLAVAPVAANDLASLPHRVRDWREMERTDEGWREAIAFLASRPGPVACERPALCYWSGKPYDVDMFNYGQKLRLSGDPAQLKQRIIHREFSAIAINRDSRYKAGDGRLPNSFYKLINANYRVERVLPDDIYIMVPAA